MTNRLRDSMSPYLEQHADNPVDWYPWQPAALEAARTGDRPILLSIGYSACHWCHVMAHESFENAEIAEKMNAWFVNIKVDREERPDLDRVYQLAHQLLTGRGGGWPLTVFLDPSDLTPFVAGTYFPPSARHGLIGFDELLERVHSAWLNQRDTLRAQNRQLVEALTMVSQNRTSADPDAVDPGDDLVEQLLAREDRRHGGFGTHPKFPQAPLLAWLHDRARYDESAGRMLLDALRAMARNGLFDQVGGGFFRYSVDAAWEIPHFEKMLSDNAQLLSIYAGAAASWCDAELAETAIRTGDFIVRDLGLDGGGFASSLDADAAIPPNHRSDYAAGPEDEPPDSAEGASYLWKPADVDALFNEATSALVKARFGLDGPANFEGRFWHLVQARGIDELTRSSDDAGDIEQKLEQARQVLLDAREQRARPARDDKLVAGLNGLAIASLVRAGRLLQREDWIDAAETALTRIRLNLFDGPEPRAVLSGERSDHPVLLDDLAALLDAALALLSARFSIELLDWAQALAERIEQKHFEPSSGTLYLTPTGHERLIMRPPALADDATPAGAGLAVLGWTRLAHLVGEPRWLERSGQVLDSVLGDLQRAPSAHATLLLARKRFEDPLPLIVVGGPEPEAHDWHQALGRRADIDSIRVEGNADDLPDAMRTAARSDRVRAWVCVGRHCLEPANTPAELDERIEEATS